MDTARVAELKAALGAQGLLNPGKVFRAKPAELAAIAGLAPRSADIPAVPRG